MQAFNSIVSTLNDIFVVNASSNFMLRRRYPLYYCPSCTTDQTHQDYGKNAVWQSGI